MKSNPELLLAQSPPWPHASVARALGLTPRQLARHVHALPGALQPQARGLFSPDDVLNLVDHAGIAIDPRTRSWLGGLVQDDREGLIPGAQGDRPAGSCDVSA